jgi:thymidylate kinase
MCVVAFSKAFSTEPEMVFDDLKSIRVPDISILIDISVDLAIERILHRGPVALDETPPILAALRAAYLGCAHIDHRVYVIDGSLPKKRMLGEALVAIDMRRQQILDKEVGAKLKSL